MTGPELPPQEIWGVGRVVAGETITPWPVSPADMDDEAEAAGDHLRSLGVGEGDLLLIVSKLSETIQVAPLEMATNAVGALFSSADATPNDAFRTHALIRQLSPVAVIGVDGVVVDALKELGRDLADVFGGVGAVATADAHAYRDLVDAGCLPRRWLKVGSTTALECAARQGAHLDGTRWQVDLDDGQVLITNLAPRLTRAERLPTGIQASIVNGRCACGRDGPRLVVE